MKDKIIQEVKQAVNTDNPVGFIGVVISKSDKLDMLVPTIISIEEGATASKHQQYLIREKLQELGMLLAATYT